MSIGKDLLIEEYERIEEPSLAELFEEALARSDEHDRRHDARIAERRKQIRLVITTPTAASKEKY
jgi:hypothetical protein